MSDLHLEAQDFRWRLPQGDVLIVAGDLCHASCLQPVRSDLYAVRQRDRVMRFVDTARASFAHVLLIAGNHDHYDGIFEDTAVSLRQCLPGVTVLDDEHVDIAGVRFFGTTLWSDFERGSPASMDKARRGVGEFFFVKTRTHDGNNKDGLAKFRPQDALQAHHRSLAALKRCVEAAGAPKTVVISHHAPSLKGLNPLHAGNGLDGAYASDLEATIASLPGVPVWVHGHTHVRRTYRIGDTLVRANCRGFDNRDASARTFSVSECFAL
jgi:3',5'-cyclic AMP phosphodiesterase CpdA